MDEYDLSPRMVQLWCECMPLNQLYKCTRDDPAQLDAYRPADAKSPGIKLIEKEKEQDMR